MAESGSETEIKGVKEALGAGQQLLQKLYLELDKEREASASAASEALSMILRLQEEKAAMKMEASQYQRMAEEKICHAEEYLASFEEMILQKEMEIASLEFQVQAYRYKLLSFGCPDLSPSDQQPRFDDKFFLHKKDLVSNGETGVNGKVRRAKSLPPTQFDELYDRDDAAETEKFEILKPDCSHLSIEEHPNRCSWEQIKMLDEQIKEISDSKGISEDRYGSLNVGNVVCSSTIQDKPDEVREVKPDVSPKCSSSSSVQDIFEIPEADIDFKLCRTRIHLKKPLMFEGESRLGNPDPVLIEPFKLHHKDEQTRSKKASSKSQKNKSSKLRRAKAIGSGSTSARQQIDEIVAESQPFQQLCHIIEKLEQNKSSARQENTSTGVGELLKEIQEQLNSIQSEMKSLQIKQQPAQKNSLFDLLQEAMLHCWF